MMCDEQLKKIQIASNMLKNMLNLNWFMRESS